MASVRGRVPPGPPDKYPESEDLLLWLGTQFECYGDVFKASIHGVPVYVVSAPDLVEHVLMRNWRNYPKGRAIKRIALLLGNGLMVSKGELWIRQRRMIQPAFSRAALAGLADVIRAANAKLLARWRRAAESGSDVNVTRDISIMILDIVLRSIFGEDYDEVAPQFGVVAEQTSRNLEFAVAFTSLGGTVVQLAQRRRAQGRTGVDFLGALMQARDRDSGAPMSDAQLAREIMTLIVAGHETTASTLNWTWYLLARDPSADRRLFEELERLMETDAPPLETLPRFTWTQQVLEEALRLYPPGWLMTRKALADDMLGEYFVPAGTEIYISPYYIQRHPGLWHSPDRFQPERFAETGERPALASLPFSVGPRNCIGEHLARMEMQIHLMMIARHLRLEYREPDVPPLAAGVNLLSARELMMTPVPRVDSHAS